MVSYGYSGAPLAFEGGVRGGGVSEPETQPAQYPYPKKIGYDEHKSLASVHGMPGVEGMPGHDGMMGSADFGAGDEGHGCHGCGAMFKTPHGLARHALAKHGFSGMKHALGGGGVPSTLGVTGGHGTSFTPGQEFRGETDNAPQMEKIKAEFDHARELVDGAPNQDQISAYDRGDRGGSYGRMSQIVGK
jgi:hypothetical protein